MSRGRILFADNDEAFRTTRAHFLTAYDVLHASSVKEAEQLLQDQWVHLAILDIRLQDDDEEQDTSGLSLAKHDTYRPIPKIMLTGYPTYQHVREALGPLLDGLPAAVDFIAKQDGPEVLLQAIEKAFASYVRINWDLDIQSHERQPVTFASLASFIENRLESDKLPQRAQELEELFRRLFYEKSQITLDRLLWQRMGRVALTVFTFQEGALPESFVVVCGKRSIMEAETARYKTFAPKLQEGLGTVLTAQMETAHFSANAYMLTHADLEQLQPLVDLYKSGVDKA